MRAILYQASIFVFLASLAGCQSDLSNENTPASASLEPTASVETAEQIASRERATFPAQQRALADPEVVAHGEGVFGINCRGCHGPDLRGGDLGGPNLLRSQVVLKDSAGELIGEVIREGRNNPGMTIMPPLPLSESDIIAVSAYIHSVVATSRGQGAPPPGEEIELNILVGDANAGKRYFNSKCSGCHSIDGDLKGIATKISSAPNLQDSWVAGRRRGTPDPDADPERRSVLVSVTLSSGEVIKGKLGRRDDFVINLQTEDGQYRSFTLHENTSPSVTRIEVSDPMAGHRKLLSEYTDEIMHNVTAYLVTLK